MKTISDILLAGGVECVPGIGRCRCPIHGGTNRSAFSYDDEKGVWYCFSCGMGGDIITLARKMYDYSYREAVAHVGGKPIRRPTPLTQAARRLRGLNVQCIADVSRVRIARHRLRDSRDYQAVQVLTDSGYVDNLMGEINWLQHEVNEQMKRGYRVIKTPAGEMEGKVVRLAGYPSIAFVLVKDKKFWHVLEYTTGYAVESGKTQAEALELARQRVGVAGDAYIRKCIDGLPKINVAEGD